MNNLSKSKYITFCQCPKALWLKMYKPEEIEIDPLTQARFDAVRKWEILPKVYLANIRKRQSAR